MGSSLTEIKNRLNDRLLVYPVGGEYNINAILEQLACSKQLPIEWIARIQQTKCGYRIGQFINKKGYKLDKTSLEFDALFEVSEFLLTEFSKTDINEFKIHPVPWNGETLLFGICDPNTAYFPPLIELYLQALNKGRYTLALTKREQEWKDALILFDEWILGSRNLKEAFKKITKGFVRYLSFERCGFFYLSDNHIIGAHGYQFDTKKIQNIRAIPSELSLNYLKFLNLVPSKFEIKELRPFYLPKAVQDLPSHFVKQFQLDSVVFSPIYAPSKSQIIGVVMLDLGPNRHFQISEETKTLLLKFGQSAGEILAKFHNEKSMDPKENRDSYHLSPREMDVLKLMADGTTTSEAARLLNLSEYTVRDYISTIMQKMDARNRTEAASKAIRKGII